MESLERVLADHPFCQGLSPQHLNVLNGCAANVTFEAGGFIFRHGQNADTFYLLRHGQVALELATGDRGHLIIDTLTEGDVLGYSWLFPPYQYQFDGHATTLVRAISIDGKCLRAKLEADPAFGYPIVTRFSQVVLSRLQATRLQLLDIYGTPRKGQGDL